MRFNAALFEDLSQHLGVLGAHFSSRDTRSKDNGIRLMAQEAQLYAFMMCHITFSNLLEDIYAQSDISKKEGSDPKNAIGEVLTWLYREGKLTPTQVGDFAQQFESATVLAYDSAWLSKPEDKALFNERQKKISRYYYMMTAFVQMLTKQVSFTFKGTSNGKA